MKSRESSQLLEVGQVLKKEEEKQFDTPGKQDYHAGQWTTTETKLKIKQFPSQEENPPLQYPCDWKEL